MVNTKQGMVPHHLSCIFQLNGMKSIGISSQSSAIETFDGIEPGSILIILITMRHSHLLR